MCATGAAQAPEPDAEVAVDDRAHALELYRQSRLRYEEGDYERAASLLREAYDLHPEPNLLYNLARAYGNLGDFERAIDAYERFLESEPRTELRPVIEARIENYSEALAERRAEQERRERERRAGMERERQEALEQARRAALAAAREEWTADPVPWVVAGAGALSLGAGVLFGALSSSARTDAEQEPGALPAGEASDRAVTFAWIANGAFALGGLLVVTGVVWGAIDLAGAPEGEPEGDGRVGPLRPSLGPAGVRVAW